MKIVIDADGCPVTRICVNTAKQYCLKCIIVCDTSHIFDIPGAETVTVSKGSDSADFFIANLISRGDIAVTQDYGLAAMCLSKNALVINQNGLVYTNKNIDSLLMQRHMSREVRMSGGKIKGPLKRTKKDDEIFLQAFKSLVEQNLQNPC